jgi:hypothetical protein
MVFSQEVFGLGETLRPHLTEGNLHSLCHDTEQREENIGLKLDIQLFESVSCQARRRYLSRASEASVPYQEKAAYWVKKFL